MNCNRWLRWLVCVILVGLTSSAFAGNPLTALAVSDPDQFSWTVFAQVVAPVTGTSSVTFQTWASNADTFNIAPTFPSGFQRSVLAPLSLKGPERSTAMDTAQPDKVQEVRRNRAAFDFITGAKNGTPLVTQAELAAVFQKNMPIVFPDDAIEVKALWWPVDWITAAGGDISHYFTGMDAQGGQIALVGLHILTKATPNWTWATFEHEDVPGRCDFMGCVDHFGAVNPEVSPADQAGNQYEACTKSSAAMTLFQGAGLADVWQHYCLKGSQLDFTQPTGVPTILGNSLIESPVIQTSSCISCHSRAAIDANGQNVYGFGGLSFQECNGLPTCSPNGAPKPQWFYRSLGATWKRIANQTDFVWSIPFCALPSISATKNGDC